MSAPSVDAESDTFARWTIAADAIRATTKRLEKLAVLETYLPSLDDASLAIAAHFLSGIVFPRHDQRTTRVGGSILWTALIEPTGASEENRGTFCPCSLTHPARVLDAKSSETHSPH